MSIIWSPLSVEQVRDIASYIALDKPSAAEKWVDEVFGSVDRLADFPQSGRIVAEIKRADVREVVLDNYRIIYKILMCMANLKNPVLFGKRDPYW